VHGGFFYFLSDSHGRWRRRTKVYRDIRGNFSNPSVNTQTQYQDGSFQDAWKINRFLRRN